MGTIVEVVLLSARDGTAYHRATRAWLDPGQHPDTLAGTLAGVGPVLLHSTSWRYADGAIVLTYAALPDPEPTAALALTGTAGASSSNPRRPSPDRVTIHDVAVHACRHLALLRRTDPVVAAATAQDAALSLALDGFAPDVAGALAG